MTMEKEATISIERDFVFFFLLRCVALLERDEKAEKSVD